MKLWFLAFIFLVSCAPIPFMYRDASTGQTVAPIYIQDTWDDIERGLLKEAIQKWNYALNGKILLVVKDEHYHYTKSSPQERLVLIKTNDAAAKKSEHYIELAWTYGRGSGIGGNRIYFVRDRIEGSDLMNVALHEIGHALGSDHMNYQGLMNPSFIKEYYQCIDKPALLAVATYRHISIEDLRWCE